jgi:hypothetical protein
MSRDEDSDALIAISPRDLTKVALQLEREADEKAAKRYPRASTEPLSNPSDEEQRLRHVEDAILVLSGRDGNNGRVGNLRKDVDSVKGLLKWLGGAVAGSVLTAAVAIYQAGQKEGAKEREAEFLRAEVAALNAEVRELRAPPPAYRPYWPRGVD